LKTKLAVLWMFTAVIMLANTMLYLTPELNLSFRSPRNLNLRIWLFCVCAPGNDIQSLKF